MLLATAGLVVALLAAPACRFVVAAVAEVVAVRFKAPVFIAGGAVALARFGAGAAATVVLRLLATGLAGAATFLAGTLAAAALAVGTADAAFATGAAGAGAICFFSVGNREAPTSPPHLRFTAASGTRLTLLMAT